MVFWHADGMRENQEIKILWYEKIIDFCLSIGSFWIDCGAKEDVATRLYAICHREFVADRGATDRYR